MNSKKKSSTVSGSKTHSSSRSRMGALGELGEVEVGALKELGKGGLLVAIAMLCSSLGFVVANAGQLPGLILADEAHSLLAAIYLLPTLPFLAYRQMYSAPRSMNHEDNARNWVLAWFVFSVIIMLLITWLEVSVKREDFVYSVIMSSPFAFYCFYSYRLYRAADEGSQADIKHRSFENLIFIPAYLLCMVSFSIGLLLERRFNGISLGIVGTLTVGDFCYVIVSIVVVAIYYLWNARSSYIYIGIPLVGIVLGLFVLPPLGIPTAKYFALAFMVTFFLGFGEVVKNLWFQRESGALKEDGTGPGDYYFHGANWAGVVYPTVCLLAPAAFKEISFLPIVLIVYIFVLVWLLISPQVKTSRLAVVISFLIGYGTPVAFIAAFSHVGKFDLPDITDKSPFQTLLALTALVGFMAGLLRLTKDLLGLNLAALTRNVWNRSLYANQAAALYLLLIMSLLICALLMCAWFILFLFPDAAEPEARSQYGDRLVLAGIDVAVLAVMAVVLTIFWPTRLATVMKETDSINSMSPTARPSQPAQPLIADTEHDWRKAIWLIVRSGRLDVSWIAGATAAAMMAKNTWLIALIAFLSLTLVTMAGFLMNDIYDREKDRIAGKLRPIATGELSVRHASRAAVILVAVPSILTFFAIGLGPLTVIVGIAFALFAYSPVAKAVPLVKGAYTAALAMSPFLFALIAVNARVPALLVTLLFLYIFFREAVLDSLDCKGDRASNVHTIAYYLGPFTTSIIGWMGMFCVLAVGLTVLKSGVSESLIIGAVIVQVIATVMFACRIPYSIGITRISMLLGMGAVTLATP